MPAPLKKQTFYSVIIANEVHSVTGRKRTPKGYVTLCIKSHPFSDKVHGYIFEHRVMLEIKLGRYLSDGEVVHHINGVKHDNRMENLELMYAGEHVTLHHLGSKRTTESKKIMSNVAKNRLSEKANHPMYKHINKEEFFELLDLNGPTKTAKILGVSRKTVYNKIEEFEYRKEENK